MTYTGTTSYKELLRDNIYSLIIICKGNLYLAGNRFNH